MKMHMVLEIPVFIAAFVALTASQFLRIFNVKKRTAKRPQNVRIPELFIESNE